MSRWFRFYDRALDDPKVQRLPPNVFKGWVNLLCLSARNGGMLPSLADIAFALRISDREADSLVTTLLSAGLIDDEPDGMRPHRWNDLQFLSDQDPTGAERQRRFRDKHRDVTRYATVTSQAPDTETDTETEKNNNSGQRKVPRKPEATAQSELEAVLSPEMARAVVEHRVKIKKPMTAKAGELLAAKLATMADPNAAAAVMLERGWQGFNPDWAPQLARRAEPLPSQAKPSGFYVMRESNQWTAWDAWYRKHRGQSPPTDKAGGWHFPSEWPPQENAA